MAKLTGVQTVNMVGGEITKIAYGGAEYAKVSDGVPRAGDIGKFVTNTYRNQFTEIIGIDFEGDPIVCIEHSSHWYADKIEYFRKLPAESPTTTDRLDSLETRVTALEDAEEAKPKISAGDYVKVSEEVVKKAEAQAEKVAKFVAIGRKVDEYKVGDIVRTKRKDGDDIIGEVEDVSRVALGVRHEIGTETKYRGVFFDAGDYAELIAPVERRFDK